MSPDNWERNPIVVRLVEASGGLGRALPSVSKLLIDNAQDFRGLTIFLGDNAECVAGLKRFGEDGSLEILWSSGETPLECLINLDKGVRTGKWRPDQPKPRKSGK